MQAGFLVAGHFYQGGMNVYLNNPTVFIPFDIQGKKSERDIMGSTYDSKRAILPSTVIYLFLF